MVRGPEVGGDTKIIKKSMVKDINTKMQSPNVRQMTKKVPVEFLEERSGVAGDFSESKRSCYPNHLGGRR